MRARIFLSSTEMRAKSERNTASRAVILSRLETIWASQSGAPANEREDPLFREDKNLVEKTAHLAWKESGV